ncbi:MAG: hypothetical protein M3O71_15850 [Bacteroidota bacterium]|nr:hypothetical protein [Bacteroidota bacterium]
MKTIIKTVLAISLGMSLFACKQSGMVYPASGAINVINVVVGGTSLYLNNATTGAVKNNSAATFPLLAGQVQVNLSTLATTTVPSVTYYNQLISMTGTGNISLFLSGASPANVDTTRINETYKNYADSLCGVRFINLAPGSQTISVNLKGNTNGSEVTSLAYRSYSSFIQYPAKLANQSYVFEIRDAATGSLIISYTLATPYFHNVTIALRGLIGGSPAAGITLVSHP